MATTVKQRDIRLDILKGIGIICVAAGHAGAPRTRFIYLFHLAIFFIAAGFVFKEEYAQDTKGVLLFVKRKVVSLWVPYVLWTAIYSFLNNAFLKLNIYTDNPLYLTYVTGKSLDSKWTLKEMLMNILKSMLLRGMTKMGTAFWFIATLLEISVAYCLAYFVLNIWLKKKFKKILITQSILSLVLLAIGFYFKIRGISLFGLDRVLSFYILFHIGFCIRKADLMNRIKKLWIHIAVFIVSFAILLVCYKYVTNEFVVNEYGNPGWLLVTSLSGWFFVWEVACFLSKIPVLKSVMTCVGQNTLAVLILHFLCFKVVNLIAVKIYEMPIFMVAKFPYLIKGGCWWLAYVLAGVGIPVLLSMGWKKLIKAVWVRIKGDCLSK